MPPKKFAFDTPDAALDALASRLTAVSTIEQLNAEQSVGRVLASDVVADRDSPAADVSAMDGYAVRLSDLRSSDPVPISGESAPGSPPPELVDGAVVRIFTGAIVPSGSEAVIMREDTEELDGEIHFRDVVKSTSIGEHIRRAGENARAGSSVIASATRITAAHRATMANFGCNSVDVYSPVRVSIITTGDEVGVFESENPKPWQLRNSNLQSLSALLTTQPWISIGNVDHCLDDRDALTKLMQSRVEQSDAVLLTGGVSMGNYDHVPDVVREVGGEVVFHGLPIRPGKPILGAATGEGKLIMGLPGNPVSATVGCRRMALPMLARLSGQQPWLQPPPVARLENPGDKSIPLNWLRLVRITGVGTAEPVQSQGSGDLVSLGQSTGFVELPADQRGTGPWPYYEW